ncbi:hypothetical protein V2J09_023595 [Rumex salicifolius]
MQYLDSKGPIDNYTCLKMEYRWRGGGAEPSIQEYKRGEVYSNMSDDDDSSGDFRLPINQRPTENVDLDNVEQASLDTQLTSSNVGFRLLLKMGWKGKGLGKDEQGITEPIKSGIRDPKLGIGKQEEEDYYTSGDNVQRRKLDIELEETEEVAKKREKAAYCIYACLLRGMVYHKRTSTLEDLENFVQFLLPGGFFCLLRANYENSEREQKIQTEVKEIRKVFFCELCNKQYKLAMEFEAHLSSYDHNHRKRFKEMREMHGSSNRDDRQKREQQRQEREMAKFAQIADARKLQEKKEQEEEESGKIPVSNVTRTATALTEGDQRKTLKFGFSAKPGQSKISLGGAAKKQKVPVASVFGNDSDEDHNLGRLDIKSLRNYE